MSKFKKELADHFTEEQTIKARVLEAERKIDEIITE